MKHHSYQYYVPLYLADFIDISDTSQLLDTSTHKITFLLRADFDVFPFLPANNESSPKVQKRFQCQSCVCFCNYDWYTRYFTDDEIPNEVEKDMRDHAKDHQVFGTWGIKIYKQFRREHAPSKDR